MSKVVLISCVKKKLPYKAKVRDLYISPLFRGRLRYAESLEPDKIFVLSAKYHLLDLDDEIKPYDLTLNNMFVRERKKWAEKVIGKLEKLVDLKNDKIIGVEFSPFGFRLRVDVYRGFSLVKSKR